MSFLLDPIESGINDLLDPLTAVLAPPKASSAETAQSAEIMSNSQSTTAGQDTPTETAVSVNTPATTVASSTTSTAQDSSTSGAESTTSGPTRISSSISEDSTTASTTSSFTQTTISTSTTSKSFLSISSSAISTTSSTPAAPSAIPPLSPAQSSSHGSTAHSEPGISTAGIVIAIVFAVALLVSITWLIFRFCPPVRRRIDAWSTKGREKRSYREAIDGPPPPEKDDANSFSSLESQQRKGVSAQAAEKIGVAKRPFSFFGIGTNPDIEQKSGYSWRVESASGPVHQQYLSPNSANTPQGDGLGLGRVSLLRNHSLLRKAGYTAPLKHGPNVTQTQAQTAGVGQAQEPKLIPLQLRQSQHQQDARHKPLPAPLPVAVVNSSPSARSFSYENVSAAAPQLQPQPQPRQAAVITHTGDPRTKNKNSPLPRLQLEIPPTPVERRSQIGLAVTSSTPPAHRAAKAAT